ncbi:MAG: endonuclease III [Intestinibacillus sp.]
MTKKERAASVTALLKEAYPDAVCALEYQKDYELLFATRLSAQCTDARVNLVTKDLFANFPTLQSFADAPVEDIEEGIRTCGLFHTKARDIKAAAQMLLLEFGGKVPDTMADLLRLPGVGRKTANLVLGDIYGQPAVVTDTHCIRLSNRLGLVKNLKDPVKVETELRKLLDPRESSDFCHRLVLHGREVCTARSPRCQACCLAPVCASFPIGGTK